MENVPYVSVIIPVFNAADDLKRVLDALSCQTYPQHRFEIIVVDNGSEKNPCDRISMPDNLRFDIEPVPGSYAARNRGIGLARGSILAFTDADCVPREDWLEKGLAALRANPDCGLVGGRVEVFTRDSSCYTAVELYEMINAFPVQQTIRSGQGCPTANLFTTREMMDCVGVFSSELKSGADFEWCQRAQSHGRPMVYASDAVVRHPARESLPALLQKKQRTHGGYFACHSDKRAIYISPRRFLRSFWVSFFPDLKRAWRITRNPMLTSWSQRIRVAGIVLALQYVRTWETIRLRLGGQARR